MDFSVKQNQILRTDVDRILTTGNVNSVVCNFSFDEGYDGLNVFAVFYRNETLNRMVELIDGSCIIPWEVLEEEGILYVGAYGTKTENNAVVKRITTNSVAVRVSRDLSSVVLPDAPPTPDEWTSYRTEILGYKQTVEAAAITASAKANAAEGFADTAQTAAETASLKADNAAISAQNAAASKISAENILSQIVEQAGGVNGSNIISTATQTNLTGLLKGNGEQILAAIAGTDYASVTHTHGYDALTDKPDLTAKQDRITSTGILKGNGNGSVTSATAGTDYATPAQVNTKQNMIYASGILKGNGAGTISAATAGTDYVAPIYFSQATPVDLTMINGAASQGWYCQVYKCGNIGMVILAITVSSTQGIANNTTIANLPTGYYAWQPAMVNPSGNASNTGAIGVINGIVRVSGILAKGSYTCCIPYIIA